MSTGTVIDGGLVELHDGFRASRSPSPTGADYEVRSLAADGALEFEPRGGVTTDPTSDIIYSDMEYVQWPRLLPKERVAFQPVH